MYALIALSCTQLIALGLGLLSLALIGVRVGEWMDGWMDAGIATSQYI